MGILMSGYFFPKSTASFTFARLSACHTAASKLSVSTAAAAVAAARAVRASAASSPAAGAGARAGARWSTALRRSSRLFTTASCAVSLC